MLNHNCLLSLFILFSLTSYGLSLSYRASVVDYSPAYQTGAVNRSQALQIMNENLDNYETFLQEAQNKGSQIILFPEDGLYGAYFYTRDEILPYLEYIPDINPQNRTEIKPIPCEYQDIQRERSPILVRSSCLALQYGITLVLNMGEIRYCSKEIDNQCPEDLRYQFNTLVAFSSTGAVRFLFAFSIWAVLFTLFFI